MEERADSIKSNATQAMVKINTLEQDNVSYCKFCLVICYYSILFRVELLLFETKLGSQVLEMKSQGELIFGWYNFAKCL